MKIKELIPKYLSYLTTIGRSYWTIREARYTLSWFVKFLENENVFDIEQINQEILFAYQEELSFHITENGAALNVATQIKNLCFIRGFTRYLREQDYLVSDPGEKIKLPKGPKRLPRAILSANEVKQLLNAPDMQTCLGYRDRVVLEILYDTGIRRMEATLIKLPDLDLKSGYIHICGKYSKDRVVPLSKRVCELTSNYLLFIRPLFVRNNDPGYLILTRRGSKMTARALGDVVKRCAKITGIKKTVTTHMFRHTCATHMLKNGAPIGTFRKCSGMRPWIRLRFIHE
jgi:integrase/recombinase XerD